MKQIASSRRPDQAAQEQVVGHPPPTRFPSPSTPSEQASASLPAILKAAAPGTAPLFRLMVRHQGGFIEPKVYVFTRECIALGRAESNEVVLSDELRDVSRRHSEIRWKHGQFRLIDLDSKNATRLNGRPIEAGWGYLLRNGDRIEMGCYWIDFFLEEASR